MKKYIAILVLLAFSATLGFSQQAPEYKITTVEKKVLNKIKRNLQACNYKDFIEEGSAESFIVNCYINDDKVLEVTQVYGKNTELANNIQSTLKKHPVKCDSNKNGEMFSFRLTFEHRPGI